ncbi:MAG: signal peptidase I [Candidatus Ancaeobacter aquaticus]|nr:signal peptidase I [Candidatus Ancaeobacter aquaticus]
MNNRLSNKNGVIASVKSFFHRHPVVKEYTEAIIYAFIIAMFVRTFIVQAYKIPTGSMEPTLHGAKSGGDRILVNKFLYYFKKPERGDIIVFKTKGILGLDQNKDYIKRLVGLPGDSVEIIDGHLYINGTPLVTPDTFRTNTYYNVGSHSNGFGKAGEKVLIPKDHYYVLGDNSANSRDSRYWGFVPENNIKGKAFLTYWPPSRINMLE